ncbi:ribosomal protein S18 acetylase RimI-like enzyme [Stackebrandtia albiflava]|uniref:Ribosomal protein S18 acetylase RimI-like enzyme n=1 Tax=Stackebrandtia albiflava TaxID=406432 RepID=A0A562V9C5_9ACTN|nr:GNAT family N-acetyltransferase [Stackebrandtia albiflava]TWJ14494.1 ribosomal protein S18 acetylase RimI-like enzyme [Stackebrandtia albiflava]
MTIRFAYADDAEPLSALAAETFPLACPPTLPPSDIRRFITEHLSPARFTEHLTNETRTLLLTERDDRITGYALLRNEPPAADVAAMLPQGHVVELNKFFLRSDEHGNGTATALLDAVTDHAATTGAGYIWLGVSRDNARANRFYQRHGFSLVGHKSFTVGGTVLPEDFVRLRTLPAG